MIFKRFLLCAVVVLLLSCSAFAEDPTKDQANCYTTWDDSYLYIAFRVDCPDVRAANTKPNTNLDGDDTVEFYIETDNKASSTITPACFSMAISAAGGSNFRAGTEAGELKMTPAFTFKYGATVQGTINNPEDIDTTYSVEMAVPWSLIGMKPPSIGDMVGFNVIIRSHADPKGFISLSPRVKTEEDTLAPNKWVKLVFAAHSFGVATLSHEKILSAKYIVRAPLIDGVISDKEWHKNTSFALDLPMPAGFVYEAKFPIQRTVLARYSFWYQADSRKQVPVQRIRKPDGTLDMLDVPADGVGPWLSYDRVQWHKDELLNMAKAGITVVLPDYLAAASEGRGFADKGLDCMVAALDELRKENKPYPMVGMFFDPAYLKVSGQPLLAVYGAIKDFFSHIPARYRASAPAAKPHAGQPAAIICLANRESLDVWTPEFVTRCTERFVTDFGSPVIWLADSSYESRAGSFDGVAGGSDSRISLDWITADDSYDTQWDKAIADNPQWVICDAWNDYTYGKCMAPTARLGVSRVEATNKHTRRFIVERDYSARFLRCDIAPVIPSKQIIQAQVTIRNVGNSAWRAKTGYALGYRWYRSGRFFGESKIRRPLENDVAPGETVNLAIGIGTVTASGSPMPEGPCELHLGLIRASDGKWFSSLGDSPTMIPINIAPTPELQATLLSASAPNMIALGADYPVSVKVRNDGTETLKSSNTQVECRLFKVLRSDPDAAADEVDIPDLKARLPNDCKSGEIIDVPLKLAILPNKKSTLDLSSPENDWAYQLRFDILKGSQRLSEIGTVPLNSAVELMAADFGPRIVDTDVPVALKPSQTLDAKVVLRNTGVKAWEVKKSSIGYHWYTADGTEVEWDGATSPIKTTVGPQTAAVVSATVKAPAKEGKYVLVWDVNIDNKWLSTEPLSRGGDILAVPVEVSAQSAAVN
ncbi:MAG: sugar-binding protein [Armatimonadota bacterium]